jgi:hypothetical protein
LTNTHYESSYGDRSPTGTYSAHTAGASAHFRFYGRSIAWIAPRDVDRGKADVYLDGVYAARVDLYAPEYQAQQEVFTQHGLSEATLHKLTIEVLGSKRASARGRGWISMPSWCTARGWGPRP